MSIVRKAGTTDVSVVIRIIDSTDGTPETGVTSATAGLALEYRREGATSTAITEADLTNLNDAHSDGGMKHIGNGYYRIDLPDAACSSGSTGVLVHGVATGMVVIGEYVQLVAYDPFDGVRAGLTALPNAAADAAGGLPISDAGGLDLDAKVGALTFTVAGKVDANATHFAGTAYATALAAEVDAVWDEATAGHSTAGTTGKALTDAGSAGDPWSTALPGAYGAGTAGKIVGDNLNATVSSRLPTASYTAPLDAAGTRAAVGLASANLDTQLTAIDDYLDTEVAAIKAKTDQLTFTTANQVDATTVTVSTGAIGTGDIASAALNEIADAVLDRNMATGVDSGSTTVRTPRQALRAVRNKVAISAGTATIYKEDDATSSWTAAVTTDAALDPIVTVDPAGP